MNLLDKLKQKFKKSNVMKICLVVAELFHADGQSEKKTVGQTDRHDEANGHFFSNYVNTPKNEINYVRMRR